MKIVYITTAFLPSSIGGSEVLTRQYALAAIEGKHEAIVITSDIRTWWGKYLPFGGKFSKKEERIDGIQIIRLPHNWMLYTISQFASKFSTLLYKVPIIKNRKWLQKLSANTSLYSYGVVLKGLKNTLHDINPDIVHVTPLSHVTVYKGIEAVGELNKERVKRIKLIITTALHFDSGVFTKTYDIERIRLSLANADAIVCTTAFEKMKILNNFALKKDKIQVINIGIPFPGEITNKEFLGIQKLKKETNTLMILFMGTRTSGKGLFDLIHSLEQLKLEGYDRVRLFVGGVRTIQWRIFAIMNKFVKRIDYVIDLPYLEEGEKATVFSLADIFVLPSRVDSFGIVYIEAMAHSLPIIYANEPPQREIINDAGLYAEFGDVSGLTDVLRTLLDSKELREKTGHQGNELFKQLYTQKRMFDKVIELYSEI